MRKLLILSGKGGTGKTTVASSFIKLNNAEAFADCDVDAPNLHLVMKQKNQPINRDYIGMGKAEIDNNKCTMCEICQKNCRFDAIHENNGLYGIDAYSCEGCGVCEAICPNGAIKLNPAIAGELRLYLNDHSAFSTAQLKMGSGTSGKLVSEVKKQLFDEKNEAKLAIIDGSPGIGCPVIASISGVDMVLIVAEPSLSGISDMNRVLKTAHQFGVKTAVCINKYDISPDNSKKIETICQEQDIPLLGKIPFDTNVISMMNVGKSIMDMRTDASLAIKDVYDKAITYL